MPKEETQSYRLWSKAVKEVRKYERKNKLEKNLSKTILDKFKEENAKTI